MKVETTAAISIRNLKKVYGKSTIAADDVSLEIARGKITALLGPNGAGKTTTLKSILGIIHYQGEISVLDRDISDVRSKVSFVPEEKSFYDSLTLEKAFNICAMILDEFDQEKARRFAETFDLPLKKRIRTFSHGMKTAAYLSIALSENADIFILDEPTWGLDPIRRDEVLDIIAEIASNGKTVLYTSHIIPEVERIAEIFSIMYKGRILYTGELASLATEFRVFEMPSSSPVLEKERFESELKRKDKVTVLSNDPSQWERVSSVEGVSSSDTDLQTFFHLLIRGSSHEI